MVEAKLWSGQSGLAPATHRPPLWPGDVCTLSWARHSKICACWLLRESKQSLFGASGLFSQTLNTYKYFLFPPDLPLLFFSPTFLLHCPSSTLHLLVFPYLDRPYLLNWAFILLQGLPPTSYLTLSFLRLVNTHQGLHA